jgi:hypothetical protein
MSVSIKIGADPEVWVREKKSGKIVSAHNLLPGTKLNPYKVPKGAVQVDGTAAEFNINPAGDTESFANNINTVLSALQSMVGDKYDLVFDPVTIYESDYFKKLPPEATELGCNPDYNAYTEQVNPAPNGQATTMRSAAGHIHVGWCKDVNPNDPDHFQDCLVVVKELDYHLGLFSLLWDPDNRRRSLYGKAGAFRPKPYGVEYRTMSNVWLRSIDVQKWVSNSTTKAMNRLFDGRESAYSKFGNYAKDCIDNNKIDWHDSDMGIKVRSFLGLPTPKFKACLNK